MTLEHGLALGELLEMKISLEREARGESGEEQPQPTAGSASRPAVPPSAELSDGKGVAPRRKSDSCVEAGKCSSS